MRRIVFVVFAVLGATLFVSLGTLSAQAQSADQYGAAGSDEGAVELPQEATSSQESTPDEVANEASGDAGVPEPPEAFKEPSPEGLEDRVVNEVAEDPYSQVVDNATRGRFLAPGWQQQRTPGSYDGTTARATNKSSKDARFKMDVPQDGYYTLYAHWPARATDRSVARFGVSTPSGVRWEEVDQELDGGTWVRIGSFEMTEGDDYSVRLAAESGALADAVMISKNVLVGSNAQMVSVGDPEELSGEESATTSRASGAREISSRGGGGSGIVRTARRHLGNPYDFGHANCQKGMRKEDCSCLTRNVFLAHGRKLVDSPVNQYRVGTRVPKSRMRPGDLVFHDLNQDRDLQDHYADHVSIYSGNGNIIHASSYFGKVVESKERYLKDYWGTKRLKPR